MLLSLKLVAYTIGTFVNIYTIPVQFYSSIKEFFVGHAIIFNNLVEVSVTVLSFGTELIK